MGTPKIPPGCTDDGTRTVMIAPKTSEKAKHYADNNTGGGGKEHNLGHHPEQYSNINGKPC